MLKAIRNLVTRSLKNRDLRILSAVGRGLRFNCGVSNASYVLGTAERSVQGAMKEILKAGDTFYDVGANVGFLSVIGKRLVGSAGSVMSVEPVSSNAVQIKRNADLNGFAIEIIPVALSDEDSIREFTMLGSTVGQLASSRSSGTIESLTMECAVRMLDSISSLNPDLVKIDVEGAEAAVLRGAARTIAKCRPLLMIELHGTNAEVATELQALDYIPFVLGDSASILDAPHFAYVIAAHRLDRRGRFLAERVCRTARSLR